MSGQLFGRVFSKVSSLRSFLKQLYSPSLVGVEDDVGFAVTKISINKKERMIKVTLSICVSDDVDIDEATAKLTRQMVDFSGVDQL